jgi:hypothetical protein
MEGYRFYLVLNGLQYLRQSYRRDDVFAEREDVDLSGLLEDGIIVRVEDRIASLEAETSEEVARLEAKAKAVKAAAASVIAAIAGKRAAEESRIKAEEEARIAQEEAESQAAAEKIAKHLRNAGITGPSNTTNE